MILSKRQNVCPDITSQVGLENFICIYYHLRKRFFGRIATPLLNVYMHGYFLNHFPPYNFQIVFSLDLDFIKFARMSSKQILRNFLSLSPESWEYKGVPLHVLLLLLYEFDVAVVFVLFSVVSSYQNWDCPSCSSITLSNELSPQLTMFIIFCRTLVFPLSSSWSFN